MDKGYSITFSGRFHYSKGGGVSLHRHDSDYQIQLIYDGEAKVKVDSDTYVIKQGDILFLRCGCSHEFTVISDGGMKTLEIKFSNPDPEVDELLSSISVLFLDRDNIIFSLFSHIVEEGYKKMPDYKLMSTTLLTESLIQMKRLCSDNCSESYNPTISSGISLKCDSRILQAVTDYVYKNISEKFSLHDMAEACGFNQDYIYRTIMRLTGMTTIQYVNSIKFERAKNLIQYSELSLSEISWTLGFASLQYFSRFFRERAKMTPTEYLERTRNKVRTDY